ncbi:MAG: hypothetical protein EOM12_07000 [Verrucomicrobiae bacterium]|nr:hypothetical protein [Verrucomicrobiae bacterium]
MKKCRKNIIATNTAAAIIVILCNGAYGDCECDNPPWIEVTTPDRVCVGENLEQYRSDCGDDGQPKQADSSGNCPPCDPCPDCEENIEASGPVPGVVTVTATIDACNGSDTDSKDVTVVGVTGVVGPDHACATESKAYSVTTTPAGNEDMVTWNVSGPANPSVGSGASFGTTFREPGQYYVEACCGISCADIGVEVGADPSEPETSACDPILTAPPGESGNYSAGSIIDPAGYRYGTWSKSFQIHEIGSAGPGGCNMAVSIGSYSKPGGFDFDVSVDVDLFAGLVGVSLSYEEPSITPFEVFTKGESPYLKYKIYAYWVEGTFQAQGWWHIPDTGFASGFRKEYEFKYDKYSASDKLTRVCRWCCN